MGEGRRGVSGLGDGGRGDGGLGESGRVDGGLGESGRGIVGCLLLLLLSLESIRSCLQVCLPACKQLTLV